MHQPHLVALKTRHAEIDARIIQEEQRPAPDGSTLMQLKKQKLRLKEEIEQTH